MTEQTPPAPELLQGFLERHKISKAEAGRALGVTAAAVFGWLNGNVPLEDHRAAIEVWTKGEVPATGWGLTRREQAAQARRAEVRPFEPTASPEAESTEEPAA